MNKSIISVLLLTALTFMLGSCGDDEVTPAVSYLQTGSDQRPTDWTEPNYSLYGLTMSVQVQLGDTLAKYQSSQDLMCATINGEVRAVATPMETGGEVYFPLSIASNGEDQMVSLRYYCDRLHRIYTIQNWTQFDASKEPTGDSGIYRPCFTKQ